MELPGPDHPAPAKLNLFLHVVGRRADGYHLLQSVFTLIDRCDHIRIRIRADGVIRRVNEVPGVPADQDLSVRAARELQAASRTSLGADIEVQKRIPMGAGLGGGSSDAATVLRVLDGEWGTRMGLEALTAIGARLGADVPFFLFGRPAWVEGVGERITAIAVPPRWYVVLTPAVHVSTHAIFAAPELTRDSEPLKMEDFSAAADQGFRNDLERAAVSRYPVIGEHLKWLGQFARARMTGSGACVFSEFEESAEARRVIDAMPAGMTGFVAQGLERHPLGR